jgi:pilus assembly protein Flp/PilA
VVSHGVLETGAAGVPSRPRRVDSLLAVLGGNQMLKFFSFMQNFLADRLSGDGGATAVEYGLIVALIAGAIVVAVTLMGTTISGWFNTIATGL